MNPLATAEVHDAQIVDENNVVIALALDKNPQLHDMRAVAEGISFYASHPRVETIQAVRRENFLFIYITGSILPSAFEQFNFKE